ncbi:MAG TPA: response regulator transcription factor [Steroidobacteraceae bacterium]|jgi:DNA-binding NarL/FixJ family response regulator
MVPARPDCPTPLALVVVEDDPAFQALFRGVLQNSQGIELLGIFENGATALKALRRCKPDVLLVDLGLPDMSGLEVIRACVALHPDCEIMVITVFGDEQHILQSIESGATGYLLKDALPEDLVAQIHTLREGGSPISPVIARQLLSRYSAPRADVPAEVAQLSERERDVLRLVAKGYTFPEVARLFGISPHSVMTYVKRTYRKLQVSSKTEAVYEARKLGLLRD